jgi:hypothetical protein
MSLLTEGINVPSVSGHMEDGSALLVGTALDLFLRTTPRLVGTLLSPPLLDAPEPGGP